MVDIGYLPAMELNTNMYLGESNHEWSDEITTKEAQRKLEKAFFPFKEVFIMYPMVKNNNYFINQIHLLI